jgi:hypothetical protein
MDYFKAEEFLEDEMIKGYTKELLSLKVEDSVFNLKYARLQGQIESLRDLANKRKIITARSEHSSSVNKGDR